MPCPSSCSCSSACRRPRNDESRSVDSAKRLRSAFAGCGGTARFESSACSPWCSTCSSQPTSSSSSWWHKHAAYRLDVGIMAAMFGVGGILGALAAPYLQRRVTPYVSIVAVFWALTAVTPLAVFVSNAYLLGSLFAGMAFLVPTADTTIDTYQLLLTPDEMRGRMTANSYREWATHLPWYVEVVPIQLPGQGRSPRRICDRLGGSAGWAPLGRPVEPSRPPL